MDRNVKSIFKTGLRSIGGTMFTFGKRKVVKQGGSYMISLPMQWFRSVDTEMKTVTVEMDSENALRVIAGEIIQDQIGY
jgi:hypothetical protein